jgi:hypothetical protein
MIQMSVHGQDSPKVDFAIALVLRSDAAYLTGISIWLSECAGKL